MSNQLNKIAIFQAGYGVFGVGRNLDEAKELANLWVDGDLPEVKNAAHCEQVDGKFYFCEIIDELANKVESEGGDVAYDIVDGVMVNYE